jgi:hypothetical protein
MWYGRQGDFTMKKGESVRKNAFAVLGLTVRNSKSEKL